MPSLFTDLTPTAHGCCAAFAPGYAGRENSTLRGEVFGASSRVAGSCIAPQARKIALQARTIAAQARKDWASSGRVRSSAFREVVEVVEVMKSVEVPPNGTGFQHRKGTGKHEPSAGQERQAHRCTSDPRAQP